MIRFAVTAATALVAVLLLPAHAAEEGAVATVRGLYTPTIWNAVGGEDFSALTGAALDVFQKSAKMSADTGEVGCIDFVPTVDAQDYDEGEIARTLKVEDRGEGENGDREIAADFKLFDEPREILWTMRQEGGVWKVADIESKASGWRLSTFDCQ